MPCRRSFWIETGIGAAKEGDVYIIEQILTAKGYEYMVAVGFIFVFILFYRFLSTERKR